jgi:hypothetical protein
MHLTLVHFRWWSHCSGAINLEMAQKHEVFRVVGPDSYFIGIIDFQQQWNFKKKVSDGFCFFVFGYFLGSQRLTTRMIIIICGSFAVQLERFFKINFRGADPQGLSSIEPKTYKDRFLRKIEDILDFDNIPNRGSSTSNRHS